MKVISYKGITPKDPKILESNSIQHRRRVFLNNFVNNDKD